MKDFIASLNGRDRVFNSDALFAKCDRFFPAEISGYPRRFRPELPCKSTSLEAVLIQKNWVYSHFSLKLMYAYISIKLMVFTLLSSRVP
ncbi:hypothetical protein DD590_16695 [Klebsiella pneumoniae]|uniref:Uncharacterized protein n=2 Tax=Enterobacterales TaxID=91347 RepID=A0A2X3EG10_KLEPN|nr:hypothetical protein DD590_16695 [Klebsiella pneumoniae]SQC41558.1 Uncharacterised protein [Klebsiella pneumoniae]